MMMAAISSIRNRQMLLCLRFCLNMWLILPADDSIPVLAPGQALQIAAIGRDDENIAVALSAAQIVMIRLEGNPLPIRRPDGSPAESLWRNKTALAGGNIHDIQAVNAV